VAYVVQVSADNIQTIEPIFTKQGGHIQEVPIDVSAGQVYLILFGSGFDNPLSNQGELSIPGGWMNFTATYVGPQSQFPGLDQINILLPNSLAGNRVSYLSFNFETGQQNRKRPVRTAFPRQSKPVILEEWEVREARKF
jgi:hypothetical protein